MNGLRKKLFGYKIVKVMRYRDISYLPEGSYGVPSTLVYWRSNSAKIVQEIVNGHWTVEDLTSPSTLSRKKPNTHE